MLRIQDLIFSTYYFSVNCLTQQKAGDFEHQNMFELSCNKHSIQNRVLAQFVVSPSDRD
jgi:hypothetical protein